MLPTDIKSVSRSVLFRAALAAVASAGVAAAEIGSGGWQNPDIGFTADLTADLHDLEGSWRSGGFELRAAELSIGAAIDPFARFETNVFFAERGAELHEVYALFPYLVWNLQARLGMMLAHFGHWNNFHTHALPFTSEPRVYHEYAAGKLLMKGIEFSWLAPLPFYLQATASVNEGMRSDTHDADPSLPEGRAGGSVEQSAASLGCGDPHGLGDFRHWHCPGGRILLDAEILQAAGRSEQSGPVSPAGNRALDELAYGGRLESSLDLGNAWSADFGTSLLYQGAWKRSRLVPGRSYGKMLMGADLFFFHHPPGKNLYRNLSMGLEYLATLEEREGAIDTSRLQVLRHGGIANLHYTRTQHVSMGIFAEAFQAAAVAGGDLGRFGAYLTWSPSHFQYFRLEYGRYAYPGMLEGVNRIRLQYDASIGYHTHGRQR